MFRFVVVHNLVRLCCAGFTVKDEGCCSTGINPGRKPCVPFSPPCITTRDKYVFWDACHPTQAANEIIARMAYSGPPSDSSLQSNQCKVNGRILSLCCFVKILYVIARTFLYKRDLFVIVVYIY